MYSHSNKSLALGQISLSIRNPGFALALHNNYSFLFIFHFHILLFSTLSFSLSPSWSMLVPSFLSVHSYIRGFSAYLLGGVSIAQTPQILPRPSGFHTAAKLQNSSCVQAVRGNSPIKNPKYQLCSSLILTGRESWPRTHCQEPG